MLPPACELPSRPPTRAQNPDTSSEDVFLAASITEATAGSCTVKLKDGKSLTAKSHDVLAANPDGLVCPDNTMLIHLNEPAILENVKARYAAKDIYTLTGTRSCPRGPG